MLAWITLLMGCPGGDDDVTIETGCSDEDTGEQIGTIDAACRCAEPELEIGTGITGFLPLPAELEMVHGPQGSWHLPGALRVVNSRNIVRITAQVRDKETGIAVTDELHHHVQLVDEDTCQGSYPNMFLFLDTDALDSERSTARALSCRDVTITMCMTDTGGRDACVESEVFVLPDPSDVEDGQAAECSR